jgi:hypothetical protein
LAPAADVAIQMELTELLQRASLIMSALRERCGSRSTPSSLDDAARELLEKVGGAVLDALLAEDPTTMPLRLDPRRHEERLVFEPRLRVDRRRATAVVPDGRSHARSRAR